MKTTKAQVNRLKLAEITETAKLYCELTGLGELPANEALLAFYQKEEKLEFNSFHNWKKDGFFVQKGEKGFMIWSSPIKAKKNETETEPEKKFKFFNVAYIFSSKQVKKMQ